MPADQTRASLELLYHISRELSQALDLRTVLQRVLALSVANVGGERGSIVVLDDRREPVDAAIVYGSRVMEHTTTQMREIVDRGMVGWVVHNGQPALIPDTSKDPRWLRRPDDSQERSGAKSAICLPLRSREKLVGVLTLVHPQTGYFTEDHLQVIQAIADMAGVSILNARLFEESQRQARVMTALVDNAFTLNATLRLEEVLQHILDQTAQALQVDVVLLALIDEPSQELVLRAATGKSAGSILGTRLPLGHGVAGRVAVEGRGMVVSDPAAAGLVPIPGLETNSLVAAPVHAGGRIIGTLEAVNPPAANLGSEALLVLTGIGSLAGVAINNARLFEQLESAHRRYHDLFEDSIDPIFITDELGMITEANRQASRVTGYERATLQNTAIGEVHRLNPDKLGDQLQNVSRLGTVSYESSLLGQDGLDLPVEVYVHRVEIDGGEHLQWILRDISERKRLATLQDDLIAMVYHDLRSPLANIISSMDLLGMLLPQPSDESLLSVLSIATRSAERMQRMVYSLLDIRRLEAGQQITNREYISPAVLIQEAIESVTPMAAGRQQQLSSSLTDILPEVNVDTDMVRRVIINLLENACKFTPLNGTINITAAYAGSVVHIAVEDSGPGIPAAERERIFDKYIRLQSPGSPKGLGLGLAFCRLAVQAHGGQIWVEARQPSGSRFVFTLPQAERVSLPAINHPSGAQSDSGKKPEPFLPLEDIEIPHTAAE
jgi:PAS domain S-box-containing protein